jgi:hypothetical protein
MLKVLVHKETGIMQLKYPFTTYFVLTHVKGTIFSSTTPLIITTNVTAEKIRKTNFTLRSDPKVTKINPLELHFL